MFNLASFYGCTSDSEMPNSLDMLVEVCAREIPDESLVGVLCVPSKRQHKEAKHDDVQCNLVGIMLLATPYGQGAGSF